MTRAALPSPCRTVKARPHNAHRALPALLLLPALGGCVRASAPITIAQALRELQQQLLDAGAVSAVGTDPARFAASVHGAQCASGQADPEVPLLSHELEISLSGSFTASGGFSVGPTLPVSFITGSGSRTQGQQITLPLSFVALSEVPAQSAAQRLAALSALPQAQQKQQAAPILADRDALRARIDALIAGWTPSSCTGTAPPGLLHPNLRR